MNSGSALAKHTRWMVKMKNLKRVIWVGYSRSHGFMSGKTKHTWTDDFKKARLYSRKCDVISSSRMIKKKLTEGEEVIPIPVEVNLEEEVAIILKLGGLPEV